MQTYNYAVGRNLEIEGQRLDPLDYQFVAPGPRGSYTVTGTVQPGPDRDPSNYEVVPTDTLTAGCVYF